MLVLVLEAYTEPGTSYREQNVEVVIGAVKLSPCFDQDWNLVALHHAGDPDRAFGRAAEPWEVAATIAFLASDYSSYLTGEVISVSSQRA